MKLKVEDKPKGKLNLKKIWEQTKGTMYIISLFMLVTMGLPLILPSVPAQVVFYAALAIILALEIGLK